MNLDIKTQETHIGIDPGLTGAIVAILPDGAIEFHDMPILEIKKKTQLDYAGLAHILRRYADRGEVTAAIEMVGAMPVWKRSFRLVGCDKDESRSRALEMFPTCVEYLRLKKHHGRADALLLAKWGEING